MLILRDHVVSYMLEESHVSPTQKVGEIRVEELHCGLNADPDSVKHNADSVKHSAESAKQKYKFFLDMLLELKSVAIDPCSLTASSLKLRQSQHHILNARKLLSLSNSESAQKKRKLDQMLRENVMASVMPRKKLKVQSNTEREKCSLASSTSCLINRADSSETSGQIFRSSVRSVKFEDMLSRKCLANGLEWANPSNKQALFLFDSDNSVSDSNLSSPIKPVLQTSQGTSKLLKSGKRIPEQRVTTGPVHAGVRSVNSLSLGSKKPGKHNKPKRSVKLSNFRAYCPRLPVPTGPHYQADIPDWIGRANKDLPLNGKINSHSSDKWLGTRVWPIEGTNTEISMELIGKGRPCSCSCKSLKSTMCIKLHIIEKRLTLQRDLSSAFFHWKFDVMGEQVSKSWTLEEKKRFRRLVKLNPVSKDLSFWKPALEGFPCKTRESIVSYYFNVFVLRRMRRQTRLASTVVDSDDDEVCEV